MKIKNNHLDIFYNTTDISNSVKNYGVEYNLTLLTTQFIDIGFRKPINQLFIELKTPNTNTSIITLQKWNGTAWANIATVDETNGFKKSGFLFFDEDNQTTKYSNHSIEQYWYRLTVSSNTSAMVLNGINLIFNNLEDLRMEEPAIESFYPREIQSHILSMVASRDFIVRRINNAQPVGYYNNINPLLPGLNYSVNIRNLNQFDVFDINELRDCSTFLTLYKIFANRSNAADDVYKQKSNDYYDKFENSFKLFQGRMITLDLNNDGKEDATDVASSIRTIQIIR